MAEILRQRKDLHMNPYQSPSDSVPGRYDWTLAKRFFLSLSLLLILILSCVSIDLWRNFKSSLLVGPPGQERTVGEQIDALPDFFLDWR